MEEQKTELAAPVETPAASETQPQTAAPVEASPEPRHPLRDILDKAMAKQTEEAKATEVKDPGLASQQAPAEPWSLDKWDGNPGTLPEKLKKIVTDNQAAFTQKAQEAAQLKQALEAMQQEAQAKQVASDVITQEEFEAAQLDPSKFMELSRRAAAIELRKEKEALQPVINEIQQKQAFVEGQQMITEFAKQHTDFWELHDKGLIEPFVKLYGTLDAAYEKATQIAAGLKQEAKTEIQKTVQGKKAASSLTPASATQQVEVVYVRHQSEALPMAARMAAEHPGKRVKVLVDPTRAL